MRRVNDNCLPDVWLTKLRKIAMTTKPGPGSRVDLSPMDQLIEQYPWSVEVLSHFHGDTLRRPNNLVKYYEQINAAIIRITHDYSEDKARRAALKVALS